MGDKISIKGRVKYKVFDKDGKVRLAGTKPNIVVLGGQDLVASVIHSTSNRPTHMAVGDSAIAVTAAQDDLQGTEHDRNAFSSTALVSNDLTYSATFTNPGPGDWAVNEVGIFNDPTTGIMLARFLPEAIVLDANEIVAFDWTLTFGDE